MQHNISELMIPFLRQVVMNFHHTYSYLLPALSMFRSLILRAFYWHRIGFRCSASLTPSVLGIVPGRNSFSLTGHRHGAGGQTVQLQTKEQPPSSFDDQPSTGSASVVEWHLYRLQSIPLRWSAHSSQPYYRIEGTNCGAYLLLPGKASWSTH